MRIITLTCPNCNTIVSENVLERQRLMKCPGLGCERELRFADLPEADQRYVEDNLDKYRMGH